MATYDYTGDAVAGASPDNLFLNKLFVLKRTLKAADIIASDTTLTTNAKITAGDVIQAIHVPAKFLALGSAWYTTTAEGAAETADIGIAGGDEFQDGVSTNDTAGNALLTLVGDDYGPDNVTGKFFSATDTIDVTFVNDTTTGEWILYVWGIMID